MNSYFEYLNMDNTTNPTPSEVAADDSAQPSIPQTAEAAGDQVWDALNLLYQEILAYNTAPAMLIPHLRNRELLAKLQQNGRLQEVVQNAQILERDVRTFREQLARIHTAHAGRTGSSIDADDQLASIQIWEQYTHWGASYEQVVIPTILTIMEPLLEAGAELDRARLAASPLERIEKAPVEIDLNIDAGSITEVK